ncbi:similar to Saccharomyces cerevisiae YJL058C BIT61 Subunit of TORC2 (Tor2p-Lst8p-Avo1-Avo2-Tsc11p-Bit61p-Slm1p-Slm2p) [Maudiozyma barnettii]|uniref:Similar to Saccharomyces cerevisiae YJL058C BIT61 Subunit of TORC2 (Tor2p-Lst8p-Avo1-Avo2-Tsc11p-Bit61p-Slm1p-Slm2p) n=1 Tax=Maudiozyma barnettii TaxID=61262 RepID=A0A8H2VFH2_9SACH|nr:uncharacterized protein KABA2_04S08844 [Kazachstania barnettii]CAB4254550.1 similar to Saccharomyces cerevisiae YJL058C BIT61 Subunit of TORC2 (Tor2p-Lst8p-Avo1-Avo2-Tsc11p-Bit61p-Slm1p-Slm2p) [Kazachstania barnettii]CAD1782592.1 similar to Saccharomyces cerevisiae YJL058C BIT61 Subunit of TORC2 (Tor2p-Lst8p-Avo1-Avo2-Tsc11p-Bit61p-Slm1p-Slm2p) [Kazachstania barnettii]
MTHRKISISNSENILSNKSNDKFTGRHRSSTLFPLPSWHDHKENDEHKINDLSRAYSVSSEIIPQTLTHPDEDVLSIKNVKSSADLHPSRWSHVGFQSIFQGQNFKKSSSSINSENSLEEKFPFTNLQNSDSFDRRSRLSEDKIIEENDDDLSDDSLFTTLSGRKERRTRDSGSVLNNSISDTKSASSKDKVTRLFKTNTNKSNSSLPNSLTNSLIPKKKNQFLNVTRKLFHPKNSRHIKDSADPAIPNPWSQFLHSSYIKHRSPVQFIHNTTGGIMDSGRSVYSFNPSVPNNTNDVALAITQLEDTFDSANIAILHDLLKTLPSLEENYKNFSTRELQVLSGNVWGIYCSIVVELFKNQHIWELPAKIEDINKLFEFYTVLKTESKVAANHSKFINEIEDFITTSLFVFENQIVFNYTNENAMNTALKRLGIIWQVFYQQVYRDVVTVLLPLEESFRSNPKYWSDSVYMGEYVENMLSVDYLLLKCFRNSIVLPYYQNFVHSHDGASNSFRNYILNEEDENDVTEMDKLTLLQCFGILSTIQSNDRSQQIIEELLGGVRMSI